MGPCPQGTLLCFSILCLSAGMADVVCFITPGFCICSYAFPVLETESSEKYKLSIFQHSSGHSAHYILFLLQDQLTMPDICLLKSGSSLHFYCSPICPPRDLLVSFVIAHPVFHPDSGPYLQVFLLPGILFPSFFPKVFKFHSIWETLAFLVPSDALLNSSISRYLIVGY